MLCLTLTGRTMEENNSLFWENRQYVGMAELRIDFLDLEKPKQLEAALNFPSKVDIPVILTCRRTSDGGQYSGTERKRLSVLKAVSQGDFAYVDLEHDLKRPDFEQGLKARGVKIIRSFHDFNGIPENLFSLVSKLANGGDIPKVAVMPKGIGDVTQLFRCETELASIKQKIVIGMGDYGVPTRILYKRTGSMLTFCCPEKTNKGLLSPREMSELYRADRVNLQTRIFAVIGNPVLHSVSPNIHNPGFHAIRFNAIYVPFLVDNVRAFFKLAEMLRINGFSVTIPHKREVIPYLGKITREVKQIGSCNTVVREHEYWKGINTDYYGFLGPILKTFEEGKIHSAIVIGAGGAARAVVWALRNRHVSVTILNRNIEHAKALADETMSSYDSIENAGHYSGQADVVVQSTPVGMEPDYDADPAPKLKFTGKEIVFELVYKPNLTHFLARANNAGCRLIYGLDMLVEQGKLQFEAYTGYHYPPTARPDF